MSYAPESVVGEFARAHGAKVPARLVSSAFLKRGNDHPTLGVCEVGADRDSQRQLVADRGLDHGPSHDAAEVELASPGDPDRLLHTLVQEQVGLARFEVVEASLQSIFIAKVGIEAATAPAKETVHA